MYRISVGIDTFFEVFEDQLLNPKRGKASFVISPKGLTLSNILYKYALECGLPGEKLFQSYTKLVKIVDYVKKIEQYNPSAKNMVNDWKVVDASGQTLGILASKIATMLMGKHTNYVPHMLTGDYVVVINASGIKVTGMKSEQKLYTRHSQYPGNIKKIPYNRMPSNKVLQLAVKGMLPKNKLSSKMFAI